MFTGVATLSLLIATVVFIPADGTQLVEVPEYIENIIKKLDTEIKNFGVSNLPVSNIILPFNETYQEVTMLGNVTFTAGYVMSIESTTWYQRYLQDSTNETYSYIWTDFELPNITIMYDVQSEMSVGESFNGFVTFVFPINRIKFLIEKEFVGNEPVDVTQMYPSQISAPKPDYSPVTKFIDVLYKRIKLRLSSIFWDDMKIWIQDLFLPKLIEIVKSEYYPVQED